MSISPMIDIIEEFEAHAGYKTHDAFFAVSFAEFFKSKILNEICDEILSMRNASCCSNLQDFHDDVIERIRRRMANK